MFKNLAVTALSSVFFSACVVGLESPEADLSGGTGVDSEAGLTVCAQGETLEGVDVSVYQGDVDWAAVKASGRAFAFARIGDGLGHDSYFAQNWQGIKDAGMVRGAYQFFRANKDAATQANIVVEAVGMLGAGDLPVVLDVEDASIQGRSPAQVLARIRTWIDVVQDGTGKTPIIYTGRYSWNDSVGSSAFGDYTLWIANYGASCPGLPTGWSTWGFWQYSDQGRVPGIDGNVDVNHFNGSLEALHALAGLSAEPAPAALPNFSVLWGRDDAGTTHFQSAPDSAVVQVEYLIDDYRIGRSTDRPGGFPVSWNFNVKKTGRTLEVRGLDAQGTLVAQAWGMIDSVDGTRVFIRPVGEATYEVGLERAPAACAALELHVDGLAVTDGLTGQDRSERLAIQATYSRLGERTFVLDTYNANGTHRGTLPRTFTLR